jgi:hypothetical protein
VVVYISLKIEKSINMYHIVLYICAPLSLKRVVTQSASTQATTYQGNKKGI